MSRSPTSPFWVSNQGNNTSTLYAVNPAIGTVATKVIAVNAQGSWNPDDWPAAAARADRAGQQHERRELPAAEPGQPGHTTNARFIFANLNGTISAWAGG